MRFTSIGCFQLQELARCFWGAWNLVHVRTARAVKSLSGMILGGEGITAGLIFLSGHFPPSQCSRGVAALSSLTSTSVTIKVSMTNPWLFYCQCACRTKMTSHNCYLFCHAQNNYCGQSCFLETSVPPHTCLKFLQRKATSFSHTVKKCVRWGHSHLHA